MARWAWAVLVVFGSSLTLSGCKGDPGPKIVPVAVVSGTVMLDGKPMDEPEGTISFAVPGQPPAVLPIKGGKFEGKATTGEARVEIRALRAGEPVMMDGKPVEGSGKVNYIAPKYNDQSTLTTKIAATGAKDLKFEVEKGQ